MESEGPLGDTTDDKGAGRGLTVIQERLLVMIFGCHLGGGQLHHLNDPIHIALNLAASKTHGRPLGSIILGSACHTLIGRLVNINIFTNLTNPSQHHFFHCNQVGILPPPSSPPRAHLIDSVPDNLFF
jgi:hypothetical protein